MKFMILAMVTMSLNVSASICGSAQGTKALCESDVMKLELTKFGRVRSETFQAEVSFGSGGGKYPSPIECRFSYMADVTYQGRHVLTNMVGSVTYAPVTCEKLSMTTTVVR